MPTTIGTKVPASGNIRVWWALENAFANFEAPTAAEINACLDISDSISWNDFDFALQASNTIDDPAITAIGKVSDRGAAQFGGGLSFYYPGAFGDARRNVMFSRYSLTFAISFLPQFRRIRLRLRLQFLRREFQQPQRLLSL